MENSHTVRRLALWGIPLSLGVMGLKLVAWWVTGSVALLSDGLESSVNVVAAVVAFAAITIAAKPADKTHPFGHHKAEYLSAVLEGVLIVMAALLIVMEALPAVLAPTPIEAPALGLAINFSAGVVNAVWAFVLIRAGRRYRSPALAADGQHILSDVVTSIGVLVGLVLAIRRQRRRTIAPAGADEHIGPGRVDHAGRKVDDETQDRGLHRNRGQHRRHRLRDDQQRRHNDQHAFENRRKIFRLVVAEGMRLVGRPCRIADRREGDDGRHHVDARFHTVRKQRHRARHPPGDQLQAHDAE